MARDPRLIAGAAAAVSAGFFCLASVSLAASVWSLSADEVADRVRADEAVAPADLRAAIRADRSAASLFEPARHLSDAAVDLASMHAGSGGALERRAELEDVVVRALEASPSSPYNWARLAALRFNAGDEAGAAAALRLSIGTGRFAPGLGAARARLGYLLIGRGRFDVAGPLSGQVRFAATGEVDALAAFARDAGFEAYCHAQLARDPVLHGVYVNALRRVSGER